MYILQGKAIFEIQDSKSRASNSIKLETDQSTEIGPKTIHRLIAIEDNKILEVATPELQT